MQNTLRSDRTSLGRRCSMPAMVYQICLQLEKQICCSQRKAAVGIATYTSMAAHGTDRYFLDLVKYCEREGVPFTVFEDWQSILATTRDIL